MHPFNDRRRWGGVWRRWWIALLVTAVVIVLAVAQYAASPERHTYIAVQRLRVVVVPAAGSTGYDTYRADTAAATVAGVLASQSTLAARQFDTTVAALASKQHGVGMLAGIASFSGQISANDVATALSGSHAGDELTVTARWPTESGAVALASASGSTLAGYPVPATALASLPSGATVGIEVEGSVARPIVDAARASSALWTLLERVGLGFVAGLAVAFVAEKLLGHRDAGAFAPVSHAGGTSARGTL